MAGHKKSRRINQYSMRTYYRQFLNSSYILEASASCGNHLDGLCRTEDDISPPVPPRPPPESSTDGHRGWSRAPRFYF